MKFILKQVVLCFVQAVLRLFYSLYSYNSALTFSRMKARCYTIWLTTEFGAFHKSSLISYPADIRGARCIQVGSNVSIGKNSVINAWEKYGKDAFNPRIVIGDNSSLGEGCHISSISSVLIGKNILTGRRVSIIDNLHGDSSAHVLESPPSKRRLISKGPIVIEDNVWIGDKVTILSGVTIGCNSIIGANAVVTKDVPRNSVVGGVPAEVIRII